MTEFNDDYLKSEVYLDQEKGFFKALFGGEVKKIGFFKAIASAGKYSRAKKQIKGANLIGEGLILGGLFVIEKSTGRVLYQFKEEKIGMTADIEDIVESLE